MLAHNVYFTLQDESPDAVQKLVDDFHKYLREHPGIVFFAAGTLVEDLSRPVNVRDFHVGLHVVFEDREAHDAYQEAESHLTFIDENKDTWQQGRVFDTSVQ